MRFIFCGAIISTKQILEQLFNDSFRIFFSMLTLVEYPRNQVALVENSREAIRPREAKTSFLIKNAPASHF